MWAAQLTDHNFHNCFTQTINQHNLKFLSGKKQEKKLIMYYICWLPFTKPDEKCVVSNIFIEIQIVSKKISNQSCEYKRSQDALNQHRQLALDFLRPNILLQKTRYNPLKMYFVNNSNLTFYILISIQLRNSVLKFYLLLIYNWKKLLQNKLQSDWHHIKCLEPK